MRKKIEEERIVCDSCGNIIDDPKKQLYFWDEKKLVLNYVGAIISNHGDFCAYCVRRMRHEKINEE